MGDFTADDDEGDSTMDVGDMVCIGSSALKAVDEFALKAEVVELDMERGSAAAEEEPAPAVLLLPATSSKLGGGSLVGVILLAARAAATASSPYGIPNLPSASRDDKNLICSVVGPDGENANVDLVTVCARGAEMARDADDAEALRACDVLLLSDSVEADGLELEGERLRKKGARVLLIDGRGEDRDLGRACCPDESAVLLL